MKSARGAKMESAGGAKMESARGAVILQNDIDFDLMVLCGIMLARYHAC